VYGGVNTELAASFYGGRGRDSGVRPRAIGAIHVLYYAGNDNKHPRIQLALTLNPKPSDFSVYKPRDGLFSTAVDCAPVHYVWRSIHHAWGAGLVEPGRVLQRRGPTRRPLGRSALSKIVCYTQPVRIIFDFCNCTDTSNAQKL